MTDKTNEDQVPDFEKRIENLEKQILELNKTTSALFMALSDNMNITDALVLYLEHTGDFDKEKFLKIHQDVTIRRTKKLVEQFMDMIKGEKDKKKKSPDPVYFSGRTFEA